MAEINAQRKLTRIVPSERMIADWVEQARALEPRISY